MKNGLKLFFGLATLAAAEEPACPVGQYEGQCAKGKPDQIKDEAEMVEDALALLQTHVVVTGVRRDAPSGLNKWYDETTDGDKPVLLESNGWYHNCLSAYRQCSGSHTGCVNLFRACLKKGNPNIEVWGQLVQLAPVETLQKLSVTPTTDGDKPVLLESTGVRRDPPSGLNKWYYEPEVVGCSGTGPMPALENPSSATSTMGRTFAGCNLGYLEGRLTDWGSISEQECVTKCLEDHKCKSIDWSPVPRCIATMDPFDEVEDDPYKEAQRQNILDHLPSQVKLNKCLHDLRSSSNDAHYNKYSSPMVKTGQGYVKESLKKWGAISEQECVTRCLEDPKCKSIDWNSSPLCFTKALTMQEAIAQDKWWSGGSIPGHWDKYRPMVRSTTKGFVMGTLTNAGSISEQECATKCYEDDKCKSFDWNSSPYCFTKALTKQEAIAQKKWYTGTMGDVDTAHWDKAEHLTCAPELISRRRRAGDMCSCRRRSSRRLLPSGWTCNGQGEQGQDTIVFTGSEGSRP